MNENKSRRDDNASGAKPLTCSSMGGSKSLDDPVSSISSGGKTPLTGTKWHSAPAAERNEEDVARSVAAVYKTSVAIDVAASGGGGGGGSGGGGCGGGWKPLQRQKVVTAAPTMEEDEDPPRCSAVTLPDEHCVVAATSCAERTRKRAVTVRRGYSCQESCGNSTTRRSAMAAGGGAAAVVTSAGSVESRRRWLSADTTGTGGGQQSVNSKSMECLPSPAQTAAGGQQPHHRTSFIMAGADDRKSLDSCLDDAVVATEWADRRRGMFASTCRTSVPSHLSLALPSSERRLTILSPHSHTPSTPSATAATESCWHFSSSTSSSSQTSVVAKIRKKSRPGMVLPRLVLPGSGSDVDIFSQ